MNPASPIFKPELLHCLGPIIYSSTGLNLQSVSSSSNAQVVLLFRAHLPFSLPSGSSFTSILALPRPPSYTPKSKPTTSKQWTPGSGAPPLSSASATPALAKPNTTKRAHRTPTPNQATTTPPHAALLHPSAISSATTRPPGSQCTQPLPPGASGLAPPHRRRPTTSVDLAMGTFPG